MQPDRQLHTPHVLLGEPLQHSVSVLRNAGYELVGEEGDARFFQASRNDATVTVYEANGLLTSVVYDDPTGRHSEQGKIGKIKLYLERYGAYSHWEMRMHNNWMQYWFNPADKVAMVYGLDMDVLRFNQYEGE